MTTDQKLAGLNATLEALACLERSLFHTHQDKAKYHPSWYRVFAEPTAEEICKLRAQVDAMIGLTEFATSAEFRDTAAETGRPTVDPLPSAAATAVEPIPG
ncbi:MAG: hypothetical protein U0871_17650 [Gemmataceae bacterium]